MDRGQFDALARLVSSKRSRRAAIATLLGAALLRGAPGAARSRRKSKGASRVTAEATPCYPGANCAPGKGRNTSRCDFSFSTMFKDKDVRGSNLSKSSFRGANLRGADFRGANLSGACFIGADLLGAKLGSSVNLGGALFCDTRMPDGRINDSGCNNETACCRLVTRDCPDAPIDCFAASDIGICTGGVGSLDPVAHCWNSDKFACCPCNDPGPGGWAGQCTRKFPDCAPNCSVNDRQILSCFIECPFIPPA